MWKVKEDLREDVEDENPLHILDCEEGGCGGKVKEDKTINNE